MLQLIASVLMGAAQTAAVADVQVTSLPDIFAAACLDGKARIPASEAAKIDFDTLPSKLRTKLGRPTSADVFLLSSYGRSYLYILSYAPGRGANPKICGLASDQMDLRVAADLLDARLAGSVYPSKMKTTQWLRPEDGYFATATTAGKYNVVQVNWLNDRDRKEALKELMPVSR
jgi:hypothetical protein